VLNTVARSIGTKFVYARVGEGVRAHQARRALEMLAAARVCHTVSHSAANGLPLSGESKDSTRKVILNDIGLFHALLRAPATEHFPRWDLLAPQVRGQLAEQLLGQQLRLLGPASGDGPLLHYWQREGGRPGEIDFLVQANSTIVPVEQKSGVAGTMKSLHQFMYDKHLDFAIRVDRNPPSEQDVAVRTTLGNPVQYRLRSIPAYLAGFGPPVFAT
jgi:predicted AAA+ superfamily ATPase